MRALLAASVGILMSWAIVAAAQRPPSNLPLDPPRERGASVTPAYEGWFANPDGSVSMLVGYFNRNSREALDIPVGPNNRVEPGGPDQGQPTHFEIGRVWGAFVVKVPKDFGNKAITWTIVANGESQSIPFTLNKGYPISPYKEAGMGNQPITITVWVEDPKAPGDAEGTPAGRGSAFVSTVSFHKFRGPGNVTFDKARIPVLKQGDMISATATFSVPGDYLLRVQANDESGEGGGGFQCCWTNTYVNVTVQ